MCSVLKCNGLMLRLRPMGNLQLFASELLARVFLLAAFLALEWSTPFTRVIHKEELWLYSNPATKSYINGTQLWILIVCPLPFLPLLFHVISKKCKHTSSNGRNDLIAAFMATTLLLPLNGIVTDAIKLAVGRPRPDFAYRCWPNTFGKPEEGLEAVIFGDIPEDGGQLQNLHCHGDPKTIIEGRKSFPSGHSSFSFSVYIFTFLYLSGKLKVFARKPNVFPDPIWIWKLILVLGVLLVPVCIAISRTCDYHHHWQDVTVGSLIGTLLALFVYRLYYPSIIDENCDLSTSQIEVLRQQQVRDSASNQPLLEVGTNAS